MASLIERLRAARETWIKVGPVELLVRRPPALEIARWATADPDAPMRQSIVGWRGVTELALGIPGGDASPAAFDVDLCIEWLKDDLELFTEFVRQMTAIVEAQADREKALEKN
jgi:hypothetical protein